MATLRTLLILGRASNLPTVWSNCLAGWLLGGGGDSGRFVLLCFAATCLYLGGMYLNDAFDARFDEQHRPERPIPSGAISAEAVWGWGIGWLVLGMSCLLLFGKSTILLGLLLTVSIFVYDTIHKMFALSPVLMALCRFFLVLLAASAAGNGVTGLSIWSALVLALYIVGLSYLARKESLQTALRYWPCLFLAAPLVLAFIVNRGDHQLRTVFLGTALALWILRCVSFAYASPQRNIARAVAGLLAGIPLVDLLSVWEGQLELVTAFGGFFVLALLFQRFIPAT